MQNPLQKIFTDMKPLYSTTRFLILIYLFLMVSHSIMAQGGIITSLAGNGITQYIGDGWPATSYSLAEPMGICVDKLGTIYVSDNADSRIRKIDIHDTLYTICGKSGIPGYLGDNGPATSASCKNPTSLCFDTSGNLLIADQLNHVIRKINLSTGIINTLCGIGFSGFVGDNGPATDARLDQPTGICCDNKGNIFIADKLNHAIRRIDGATGIITTVAGNNNAGFFGDNGPATLGKLSFPSSVTVDNSGNLFIADYGNSRIRKVNNATGIISTIAGNGHSTFTGNNGPASAATLNRPTAVFMSKHGVLYISDYGNDQIRTINQQGIINAFAGTGGTGYSGDGGPATAARIYGPQGIFVDDSEYVYFADATNSAIRKVSPLPTKISDIGTITDCHIYPNPTHGIVQVQINNLIDEAMITVYNCMGQLVFESKIEKPYAQLDLSQQTKGIYYLQLKTTQGMTTQKLIIN